MSLLSAPLSLGELIDRLTILEIKSRRIASPTKRANIRRELAGLRAIAAPYESIAALSVLKRRLYAVNTVLWNVEEVSRQRFRRAPIPTAKSAAILTRIARGNDLRHRIKQRISRLVKGGIIEQKSYYS